ncbi:MAG: hypothetical protein HKN43_11340 [Rhodothermales bacterium]|nr:hypothetical protein [Rhodothermales bacterium]
MNRATYLALALVLHIAAISGCSGGSDVQPEISSPDQSDTGTPGDDVVDADNDPNSTPVSDDQLPTDTETSDVDTSSSVEDPTDSTGAGGDGLSGSTLSVENYEAAISESLFQVRAGYITRILADLTAAGFQPDSDALGILLDNPGLSQTGKQSVSQTCAGGGTAEISSDIIRIPARWDATVTLVFAGCVIDGDLFNGDVDIAFANYAPGSDVRNFDFRELSVEKADGSGWTLTGMIGTHSLYVRYSRPILISTSKIDYFESTDTSGSITAVWNTEHTQRYEVWGNIFVTSDWSYDYSYTEYGSGVVAVDSVDGKLDLSIDPPISYTTINTDTEFPSHTSIPAEGRVLLTAEDGSSIQVVPGSADSGTVVYEIQDGETSLIESDVFPGAECWLEPQPSPLITCYRS